MSPRLVLASTSAARRKVLDGARIAYDVASPGVDEDAVKREMLAKGAGPRDLARILAELKACGTPGGRGCYVIGADQTLELEGRLYDKVATVAEARERLKLLRGRTHLLHAAVAVARHGEVVWRETALARLVMRDFTDVFLEDYLAEEGEAALGSVGCYRLEDRGAQLFAEIEGDYFAILGLPLLGLMDFLRGEGALPR